MSSHLGAGASDRPGTEDRDGQRAAAGGAGAPDALQLPPAAPSPADGFAGAGATSLATRLLRWGLGPALAALCLAAILLGHLGRSPAPLSATAPTSALPSGGTGAALQAPAIEARADAGAAQAAAGRAADAAQSAKALLSAAGADLRTITAMASVQHARQPGAEDPTPLLAVFRETSTRIRQLSTSAATAEQQAVADADAAVLAGSGIPAAAGFSTAATGAARQARGAVAALKQALGQSSALAAQAQEAVSTWHRIHTAPSGRLGVLVANPPATAPVQGCEAVSVEPGSPAAEAGLAAGGSGSTPAGDIISAMSDAADGGTTWTIPDCAAFAAAMAQTRVGDALTVVYYHRATASNWFFESGNTVLATAAAAGCPAPLSGSLSSVPAGSTILLQIGLSGPAGTRSPLSATLDATGADIVFPDGLLRALGYRPYASARATGVVPGTTDMEYLYRIPGTAFTVPDGGTAAALATGTLTVVGIPGASADQLGLGILQHGARLTTTGDRWTLTPPCA